MRWYAFIVAILVAGSSLADTASAAGGVECVKSQCEVKGKSCVQALYVAYDDCMVAGNKKCNSVPPAERFNCLRSELTPCATARNTETAACMTEFQSCSRTCGPLEGKRAYYWCVAYLDGEKKGTAAFCAADPNSSRPMDQCGKAIAPYQVSMSCDPL